MITLEDDPFFDIDFIYDDDSKFFSDTDDDKE